MVSNRANFSKFGPVVAFIIMIVASTVSCSSSSPSPTAAETLNPPTPVASAPAASTTTEIVPTPTIVQYPTSGKSWALIPTIVISADPNDPHVPLVQKAVDYWNQQFILIGTPFHLGAITQTTDLVPDADLKALGKDETDNPVPQDLRSLMNKMPGDIVIVFSQATFISFTKQFGKRKLIGIQGHPGGTDSDVIFQNVIAHELGHAIGLGHNNDPEMLMCGRPAPCPVLGRTNLRSKPGFLRLQMKRRRTC